MAKLANWKSALLKNQLTYDPSMQLARLNHGRSLSSQETTNEFEELFFTKSGVTLYSPLQE